MNYLELKEKNRKLAKEFNEKYSYSKSGKKLQFSLLRSNINTNVFVDFADNLDASKNDGNGEYDCSFYHKDILIYHVSVPYKIEHGLFFQDDKQISVIDINGNSYNIEEGNFKIITKNYDFKKPSIAHEIEEHLDFEIKKLEFEQSEPEINHI